MATNPLAQNFKHSALSDTDSSDDNGKLDRSWIDSFMDQPGTDWLCKIPLAYIKDEFNLYNLEVDAERIKTAYKQLISEQNVSSDSSDSFDSDSEEVIDQCTELMYGLIHARYIYTEEGTEIMHRKYRSGIFGVCPRYKCHDEKLLPVGLSDRPNQGKVKLYCPNCHQLYFPDPTHENLDGAYFTTGFAHYLLLDLQKLKSLPENPSKTDPTSEIPITISRE